MHVPDDKRRKLSPKSEKCILIDYSYEQNGYKCYNPRTKQVRVSRDVFEESASLYALPTPTPDSIPITEDEASEPEKILAKEEEEFGTLEGSLISFQLRGPNEQRSQNDQSDEELASRVDAQGKREEEDVGEWHRQRRLRS